MHTQNCKPALPTPVYTMEYSAIKKKEILQFVTTTGVNQGGIVLSDITQILVRGTAKKLQIVLSDLTGGDIVLATNQSPLSH